MHLFDRSKEVSEQRFTQLHLDDPLAYFYNFNFRGRFTKDIENTFEMDKEGKIHHSSEELYDLNLPRTVKLVYFPY